MVAAFPDKPRCMEVLTKGLTLATWSSLSRRSQKRRIDWLKMTRLARRWIPADHICHPWPHARFDAKHSR